MTRKTIATRFRVGLWDENPGLVQLLGLCPLLAVTTSVVNGLGLGLATLAVLCGSNVLISATRRWLQSEIRIPIYVLIIASLVTCVELIFKAFVPALDQSLGIFLPLIVTNCAILARAELYASKHRVGDSLLDGLAMGLGFAALLLALGLFRELIGFGTLFAGFDAFLPGAPARGFVIKDGGWLLVALPPGAFFSLAFAVAGKNILDQRRAAVRRTRAARLPPPRNERVQTAQ